MSATTFNEGSSRSHTLLRLSIESSVRPDVDADPNLDLARTLSFLNIIDLAGSESAKAALDKGHRTEGSYINKSLLTLGTVIAKLSDGSAVHIPFRDSKLTRLLQVCLQTNQVLHIVSEPSLSCLQCSQAVSQTLLMQRSSRSGYLACFKPLR